jgi:hypothetical protein
MRLMNQLNETGLKYVKCESQLNYVNYEAHAKKCFMSFKCPNECSEETQFKNI